MSKRPRSASADDKEESPSKSRRLDTTKRLAYPYPSSVQGKAPPPFQKPMAIISFSYDPSRTLKFDDSSMRYFVDPPIGAELSYGYDRWIRRPEEKGRIDGLLKAFSRAKAGRGVSLADVAVVSWRGVMTKILTAPYEDRDGWELNVMYVNGTMYFEEHVSDKKLEDKNNIEPRHRIQMYYGYAFESYGTSDTPRRPPTSSQISDEPPCWGGDVDTNVQWCSVVRTKLGNTRLLIGGEVDCIRDRYDGNTESFVELKTSLTIRGPQDDARFEKKLLKFYFQSFLLGVPEIIVGFRTPSGQVRDVQSFKTTEIPRLVRGKPGAWDPSVCLDWGQQFLSFLRPILEETDGKPETVWRVNFMPKDGVSVMKLEDNLVEEVVGKEDRVGFLPRWYWEELASKGGAASARVLPVPVSSVPGWKI